MHMLFHNGDGILSEMPIPLVLHQDTLVLAVEESEDAIFTGLRAGSRTYPHGSRVPLLKKGMELGVRGSFAPRSFVVLHCLQRK
jgi:hypothetical protein